MSRKDLYEVQEIRQNLTEEARDAVDGLVDDFYAKVLDHMPKEEQLKLMTDLHNSLPRLNALCDKAHARAQAYTARRENK